MSFSSRYTCLLYTSNEANEVLSNPEKRQKYDQFGFAGVDPNYGAGQGGAYGAGGFDFGDRCV